MPNLYLEGISILEIEALISKTVKEVLAEHLKEHFSTYYTKDYLQLPDENLLSRKQTAKLLGVSLVTLHNWTSEGRITAYRIGSRVRYKANEINLALIEVKSSKHSRKSKR